MKIPHLAIVAALVAFGVTACGGDDAGAVAESITTSTTARTTSTSRASTTTTSTTSTTTATTTVPPPTTPPPTVASAARPAAPAPATTAALVPAPPPAPAVTQPFADYVGTVGPVDPARLTSSWRPGCPVGPADLRLLTLRYLGFDGADHTGEMVVHRDVADRVVGVFRTLYGARFPIERMELVDVYGGDDDRSTMANNTSAFNCRPVTGGGGWSQHSYGRAIDINPVQNPYVYRDGHVLDPKAAPYTDRNRNDPGMIKAGDVVVSAFAAIGWGWGGNFNSIKDYQHFSANGR